MNDSHVIKELQPGSYSRNVGDATISLLPPDLLNSRNSLEATICSMSYRVVKDAKGLLREIADSEL
jgi:hypothetical protein